MDPAVGRPDIEAALAVGSGDPAAVRGEALVGRMRDEDCVGDRPASTVSCLRARGADRASRGARMHLAGNQAGPGVDVGPGFDFRRDERLLAGPPPDGDAAIAASVDRPARKAGDSLFTDRAVALVAGYGFVAIVAELAEADDGRKNAQDWEFHLLSLRMTSRTVTGSRRTFVCTRSEPRWLPPCGRRRGGISRAVTARPGRRWQRLPGE